MPGDDVCWCVVLGTRGAMYRLETVFVCVDSDLLLFCIVYIDVGGYI